MAKPSLIRAESKGFEAGHRYAAGGGRHPHTGWIDTFAYRDLGYSAKKGERGAYARGFRDGVQGYVEFKREQSGIGE